MRHILFDAQAYEQFLEWASNDKTVFERLSKIIRETARSPFEGIGKPERLKHNFKGCWSRRITQEHRLIYQVTDVEIRILSCKEHY
jgi:toxin YoeB